MRSIKTFVIVLFVISLIGFGLTFFYVHYYTDNTPPVITSDLDLISVGVNAKSEELCVGLHATDNVDGDITDKIRVKSVSPLTGNNTAEITYIVFDNSSNGATLTRTVHYNDYSRPKFHLTKPLIYNVSQTVTLLDRLTAEDLVDGDLSDKIRLTMVNLTTTVEGEYSINVMVSNTLGDTAFLPLTVIIRNLPVDAPTINLSDYLVYTPMGEPLNPKDYLVSVTDPTAPNGVGDVSKVQISSNVDYDVPGVYEVRYSYTNAAGQDYQVIFTVVVE